MSYPAPILNLNFANAKQLVHPALSFSRSSIGSEWDSNGIMRYVASGVPRFDHDPLTGICKGLLVEPAVTFLDTFSQQFDNAAWTKSNCTITANAAISPDGNTNADKIVESSGTAYRNISLSKSTSPSVNLVSLAFIKASGRTKLRMSIDDGGGTNKVRADFNLTTVAVTNITAGGTGSSATASITDIGGGYYVLAVSGVPASSGSTSRAIIELCDDSWGFNYTGDGTSGLYIWGHKFYAGSYPVSPLPTGWETTSATSNDIGTGSKTFTVGNDSTVPGKAIPAGATVRVWQTSNIANYMTGTVTSHSGTSLVLNLTSSGGSGTGVTDWTIQAGASVARAADVCSGDLTKLVGASGEPLWNGVEGTIVVRAKVPAGIPASNAHVLCSLHSGSWGESVSLYRVAMSGYIYLSVRHSGSTLSTVNKYVSNSTDICIAAAYNSETSAFYINGELAGSATFSGPSTLKTLSIGCDLSGSQQWCSTIKSIQLYNRRIADAYLPALSAL